MSSLTDIDKRYLEKLFGMQSGYVLNFSDATFGEFFRRHRIDIHSTRYQTYGRSKAKKMRAFWEREPDPVVAPVLSEMLDSYQADCDLNGRSADSSVLQKCGAIVARLSGASPREAPSQTTESFLEKEFTIPNIHKLPVELQVASIIEARLAEALKAGASLSVIFLCGSVLEGVLLGAAKESRTIQPIIRQSEERRREGQAASRMDARAVHRHRLRHPVAPARREEVQPRAARF